MKKITVLTTTRDNVQELIATYSSLANQSTLDFKWLIYDGSRSDDIEEIKKIAIGSQALGFDSDFHHAIDNSLYEAMNNALRLVETEYVIILNCGDMLFEKDTINKILFDLSEEKPDVLYGSNIYIDCDGSVHHHKGASITKILETLESGKEPYFPFMVCQQAIVYRKKLLLDMQLSLEYPVAADHKNFIALAISGKHFLYVNYPICIYFGGGFSWQHGYNCVLDWLRINIDHMKHDTPIHELVDIYKPILNNELLNSVRDQ